MGVPDRLTQVYIGMRAGSIGFFSNLYVVQMQIFSALAANRAQ